MKYLVNAVAPVVIGAVLFLGPGSALAQRHIPRTDEQIKGQVEHKLSEMDVNPRNVQVAVENGIVTLKGTLASAWARQHAIDEALEVDDVQSVVSELQVAAGESDSAVAEDIAEKVRRYVFYTIYDDVNIQVHDGVVTLTGRVTMPFKANEMAALGSRVHGVKEVNNQIQALPVSGFDDQLRASVASRIYRDPLFWNYATQINPPIHLIVENSRLTLVGVVDSELQRRKAEIIARSTFGVLGVKNKLRVEGRTE